MNTIALGIIDAQRGFMPKPEDDATYFGYGGFDELAVPDGEDIVEPVNLLLSAFADRHLPTFTTQDWHPAETAHFSGEPDFNTNWPVHCVAGTPGAELHPEIVVPESNVRFIKGMEPLERGEDDTSYSAYYAEDPTTGDSLRKYIQKNQITEVALGGLALDYCVGKSALDLRDKLGIDVTVITDATRGITPETSQAMLDQFAALGIATTTTEEFLQRLNES